MDTQAPSYIFPICRAGAYSTTPGATRRTRSCSFPRLRRDAAKFTRWRPIVESISDLHRQQNSSQHSSRARRHADRESLRRYNNFERCGVQDIIVITGEPAAQPRPGSSPCGHAAGEFPDFSPLLSLTHILPPHDPSFEHQTTGTGGLQHLTGMSPGLDYRARPATVIGSFIIAPEEVRGTPAAATTHPLPQQRGHGPASML